MVSEIISERKTQCLNEMLTQISKVKQSGLLLRRFRKMAEMKIFIYSRKAMEKLLKSDFPENVAIISFYDPPGSFRDADYQPVDYSTKTDCVFEVALHDIDFAVLPKYHLTYETYFPEADELAEFIFTAKKDGKDIISPM